MSRQFRSIIGIAVFVVVVAVSGIALTASGNMRNPFSVLSEISALVTSGGASTQPTMGEAPTGENGHRPGGDAGEGAHGDENTIQWNMFGSVLFNLWFIAAVTGVVMVAGQVFKGISKQMRHRTLLTAP